MYISAGQNVSVREDGYMLTNFSFLSFSRNATCEVTNMRSRFAKPKPNLRTILGTNRLDAHQEVPSLFVTKGEEVEIQTGKFYCSLASYKITLTQQITLAF